MGPPAQRFREWASASSTFSAKTDLIAVLQSEVDMLFVLISETMHACSTSSCLRVEILVHCRYVLADKPSRPDVEIPCLVALRYGGKSASVPGCLCDGTGTL